MATTYNLISSSVLSSSVTTFTFSSIPATYTDLLIKISARHDAASDQDTLLITTFSGSTGFTNTWLRGGGSGAPQASSTLVGTSSYVGQIPGATATSNTFDNTEIYIPSYIVSQLKPFSVFSVQENNASSAYMGTTAGLWSNTSPVTSIAFSANGNNFVSGSSFYLYGISNA